MRRHTGSTQSRAGHVAAVHLELAGAAVFTYGMAKGGSGEQGAE